MLDRDNFMQASIDRSGRGWRTGRVARVAFARSAELEVRIEAGGGSVVPTAESYEGGERASRLRLENGALLGVEHLFAALAGLGIHRGVTISVEGDELPLLDGGAYAFADALLALSPPPPETRLFVAREAELVIGESLFSFQPAAKKEVAVEISGFPAHVATRACWDGTREVFLREIASARTFVREEELDALLARGLSANVDPAAIFVIREASLEGVAAVAADEPARHKLLDLVGDMYAFGGVPLGKVRAFRPGHARNVEAMRRALGEGILAPVAIRPADREGPRANASSSEVPA